MTMKLVGQNEKPLEAQKAAAVNPKEVVGFITIKGKTMGEIASVLNLVRDGGKKVVTVVNTMTFVEPLAGSMLEVLIQAEPNHFHADKTGVASDDRSI